MKPRLIILVVGAAALAIYFGTRTVTPVKEVEDIASVSPSELARLRVLQTLLELRPLGGSEPAEEPDLSIQVEVDPTDEKHRLYYYITEAHGYYVETFDISFYYKPDADTPIEDSRPIVTTYVNGFLKANDTLKGCIDIVPGEFALIGRDMGTSQQWEAEIDSYGRARMQNPDPLPPLTEMNSCR